MFEKDKDNERIGQKDLQVSLIICTHNNFDGLKDTLDGIYQMNYEFHEIIVFDDASTDNTSDKTMYYFGDKPNFTLVTYTNQKGFPAARNEGILRAKGDYILFLDAGFLITEDSLTTLLEECPHYSIVYPKIARLTTEDYARFEKAHEKYIKFSYCYLIQKSGLYCFNGLFYDTTLEEPVCDFDFFCRAHVFGLSSYFVNTAQVKVSEAAREKLNASEHFTDSNKALMESCDLFKAIYHDMGTLETIQFVLEGLNYNENIIIKSILGLPDKVNYINKKRAELLDNNNSFYYRYRDSYFKNLSDKHFTLIEITNSCINKCSGCSRAVSLLKQHQYMTLEEIETALKSLEGWTRPVGIFGGEPTLHPDFPQVCELLSKYFPKEQRAIFTCGGSKYEKYKDMIEETFGVINFNDHKTPSLHQPILVSGYEVIDDKKMCDVLIRRCWVQQIYCHIITKRGAFFCEIASTIDLLHNGQSGVKVTPGWWKRDATQWKDQITNNCRNCGCCLPLAAIPDNSAREIISGEQYKSLKDNISEKNSTIDIYDEMHDTMSIFNTAKESTKENYALRNSKSYWYKENWLDSRRREDYEKMFHQ